jgi:GNAT superfamily N-acetyltransferase
LELEIRQLGRGDDEAVHAAGFLFDHAPKPDATERFLADPAHHLLIAYDPQGRPLGFVSGVETTHPDKGAEMFLYELGVDDPVRRHGVGTALVQALATLARERGCYGMWTGTDTDNEAALRTYARAGAKIEPVQTMIGWSFGDA